MRRFLSVTAIILALFIPGCSGGKAAELYDTARLEEKQNNKEHAAKLYEEILKKYPDTEIEKKSTRKALPDKKGYADYFGPIEDKSHSLFLLTDHRP